jgi:hypothetical protein
VEASRSWAKSSPIHDTEKFDKNRGILLFLTNKEAILYITICNWGEMFMKPIPFLTLILQTFPENIAVIVCQTALVGQALRPKLVLLLAFIGTITIFSVRLLSLSFGAHTTVWILVMAIACWKVYRVKVSKAIIGTVLAVLVLGLWEIIFSELFLSILDISPAQLQSDKWLWTLSGLPQVIFTLATGLFINKKRRSSYGKSF